MGCWECPASSPKAAKKPHDTYSLLSWYVIFNWNRYKTIDKVKSYLVKLSLLVQKWMLSVKTQSDFSLILLLLIMVTLIYLNGFFFHHWTFWWKYTKKDQERLSMGSPERGGTVQLLLLSVSWAQTPCPHPMSVFLYPGSSYLIKCKFPPMITKCLLSQHCQMLSYPRQLY